MPLHSPDELKFLLPNETEVFMQEFLKTAEQHLLRPAYQAAAKFTEQVSKKVATFCETISDQTQFAEIHAFLQNLFNPPEVNIFTSETFPVWKNYIEALMQQIFSQMPEEDTHKETMRELFDFLSNIFPKMCWVDLCVTHMTSQYPELLLSNHSVEKTRGLLLLQYPHSPVPRLTIPHTNFCCFLFNRIFSTLFTQDQLSWDRSTANRFQENYLRIAKTIMHGLLMFSEDPLHDPRLKKALLYLSHTSSDPCALQSFLDSHSLFLFSPSFFYALFLNIPWAIRFLETALSIRDEGEPLKLTHEALVEWLARSDVHATDLIEWLQELLREGKLEFQWAIPNLSENTFANLLNILLFDKNPIALLEITLFILRDHPDFLETFEGFRGIHDWVLGAMNSSISMPDRYVFFAFIVSLYTQGYLNTALWVQIKKLLDIARAYYGAYDNLIPYFQMLTKYQWRDSETINCLLSVVINTPEPLSRYTDTIKRLNFILQSDLFSHPEEVIELVSSGNPRNFPKNFQTDFMLDELIDVMKVLKIQLSAETIRAMAGNAQQKKVLHHIYVELIRKEDHRCSKIVTKGIQHLYEIGIPFEEILSIFIERSVRDPWRRIIDSDYSYPAILFFFMDLNLPEGHDINRPQIFQETIQNFLRAPEASAEESIRQTALLLSFALASKEKEPEMSFTDHLLHTLKTYFSSFQKVLNEMSKNMSDEEKEPLKKRLYALFARVIQQEKAPFLMKEATMVASTVDTLVEAQPPQPPGDGREPLPSLLLRSVVYEHSLLLFRRETQAPRELSQLETNALFVHSFLTL